MRRAANPYASTDRSSFFLSSFSCSSEAASFRLERLLFVESMIFSIRSISPRRKDRVASASACSLRPSISSRRAGTSCLLTDPSFFFVASLTDCRASASFPFNGLKTCSIWSISLRSTDVPTTNESFARDSAFVLSLRISLRKRDSRKGAISPSPRASIFFL